MCIYIKRRDLKVTGTIAEPVRDHKIYYLAAAGPDRRATFTGSGLPFANPEQAFENTPNKGCVPLDGTGSFTIELITPNSYMVGLGSVQVPPTVYIMYYTPDGRKRIQSHKVADPIPYRSLTYPLAPRARRDATFYDSQFSLIPKTQEKVLYDSRYPCDVGDAAKADVEAHANFWGRRPTNA